MLRELKKSYECSIIFSKYAKKSESNVHVAHIHQENKPLNDKNTSIEKEKQSFKCK